MTAEVGPAIADVYAARGRLLSRVRHTPLQRSKLLSDAVSGDVHLKLECWQLTGSFKVRGALNAVALLGEGERRRGLVTASAGNHGQAVALAAREFGARAIIYVPAYAPAVKQERISALGAELRNDAADYDEAERAARSFAEETGATFVHAYSDPSVIAGQGTVGLELLDEPDGTALRDIVVPVGGGGLITGIGVALRAVLPNARVIGVQSAEKRAMYEAFRAGRAVAVPIPPTVADGLAGCTDEATYRRARMVVDEIVLVEESEITAAIRDLFAVDGVVAEGAGAVAAAALLSGRVQPRGRCACIISGGNIDGHRLADILGRTE
jgi:threonine dehydratase